MHEANMQLERVPLSRYIGMSHQNSEEKLQTPISHAQSEARKFEAGLQPNLEG